MKLTVFILLGALALGTLVILFARQLRYVITGRHLKVRLFGLCLRRIRLADIDRVSKRQAGWAEKWQNTLDASHRTLVIRRRRGWFLEMVITPKNRYTFKSELERAMETLRAHDATPGAANGCVPSSQASSRPRPESAPGDSSAGIASGLDASRGHS